MGRRAAEDFQEERFQGDKKDRRDFFPCPEDVLFSEREPFRK